jgi:hypothetical protein
MSSTRGPAARTTMQIAVGLLWLLTAAVGLAAVYYLHALAIYVYDTFIGNEYRVGVLIGQMTVIIAAVIWLAAVVISGEYHLKHAGSAKSWRIILIMLGVEALIIAVGVNALRIM